jgi:hypothetical protein
MFPFEPTPPEENMTPAKPEIRYTKGPDQLSLGSLDLVRADLDVDAADASKSRNGWRETTEEFAAQALLPDRVDGFGFEARNYTPPAADGAVVVPATSGTRRKSAADLGAAQE